MPTLHLDSPSTALQWLRERGATSLVSDSRQVKPGDAFLAWPGRQHDARQHLAAALSQGAVALLAEAQDWPHGLLTAESTLPLAVLSGLKATAGEIADAFWQQPSARLRTAAVTGTNGKTSVSWWLADASTRLGATCGLIGTMGSGLPGQLVPTGLTTPDALQLHAALSGFVQQGYTACAMEASSIGLDEQRLAGVHVHTALFTNLTQDHLDYHGTMAAYWQAKQRLFDRPGLQAAVVHIGDAHGAELAERLARERPEVALWTVALARGARLTGEVLGHGPAGGLDLRITEGAETFTVHTPFVGDFNAQNLMVVAGGLRAAGFSLAAIAKTLAVLRPVPGRLERIEATTGSATASGDQPLALVDYAHTPDALEQVLKTLRPLALHRQGRLWVVFGCGGNRDTGKRPKMAAAAEALADQVVMTSDNPRHESAMRILAQMASGLVEPDRVAVIEDRREAIAHAICRAMPHDVVLVAGKGHEADQEVAGIRHPFSDAHEVRQALARRALNLAFGAHIGLSAEGAAAGEGAGMTRGLVT